MLIPEFALYPIALLIGLLILIFITSGYEGVKVFFLFVVSLPLVVLALVRDKNGFCSSFKKIKFNTDTLKLGLKCFVLLIIMLFGIWGSIILAREWVINPICPFVIVVNDDSTEKVKYEVYVALGAPIINGKTYKLNIGETLIVNESKKPLVYKTVRYSAELYQESWWRSDSSTIKQGTTLVVKDYPDYFFQSQPDKISSAMKHETRYVLDIAYNK